MFQAGAFQSDAFQVPAGVGVAVLQQPSGGFWPDYGYVRKRKTRRELEEILEKAREQSQEQREAEIAATQQLLKQRVELRRQRVKSDQLTSELRQIYAEQDSLLKSVLTSRETLLQMEEDRNLAIILALAS